MLIKPEWIFVAIVLLLLLGYNVYMSGYYRGYAKAGIDFIKEELRDDD